MTRWEYLTWVEDIVMKAQVKILVKHEGRPHWGRVLAFYRIGDVSHFRVDLDCNTIIITEHYTVIRYLDKDGEHKFPRYKDEGQGKLF